jgi:hypothetical protein
MENRSMFVGLDVHKETIDVSIADGDRHGEVRHYIVNRVLPMLPVNSVTYLAGRSPGTYVHGCTATAAGNKTACTNTAGGRY